MPLTIQQVLLASHVIEELVRLNREDKAVVASKTKIRFAQNLRKLRASKADFDSENEVLIRKYGKPALDVVVETVDGKKVETKKENPDRIEVNPERIGLEEFKKFITEQGELLKQDSDVELRQIEAEELSTELLDIDFISKLIEVGLIKE